MDINKKRLTGVGVCVIWGLLCGILIASRSVQLINADGSYNLIGTPVIASCMASAIVTIGMDKFLVSMNFFAPRHVPELLSGTIFFITQFIIYASIGLLVPWNKFKFKKNSPVPPAPEPPQD